MAKAMRDAVAALRFVAQFISRSSGSMHAGECLGVIFRAQFRFATAKGFAELKARPPCIATIRLQWNSKAKMMRLAKIYLQPFRHSFRFEAAAFSRDNDKDFIK